MADKGKQTIRILGTRGIPAQHGGFETFTEDFALYLVNKGWQVHVYCQSSDAKTTHTTQWKGVNLVHIPQKGDRAISTILFDLKATLHAAKHKDTILTLGYNTAMFNLWPRIKGIKNIINMDGIEWQRKKWRWYERAFLWVNEWCGCKFGHHLVADHPQIKQHLTKRAKADKITVIPYSADKLVDADKALLKPYNIEPNKYLTVIARTEPENNLLTIIRSFSAKKRGVKLVVLGNYNPDKPYDKSVMDSASDEVIFAGAIYNKAVVQALRYYSLAYVHGHSVGGTNPSLVEALGAGNAVIAHDNKFNKWVAGQGNKYFTDDAELEQIFDKTLADNTTLQDMQKCSVKQFEQNFTYDKIMADYLAVISKADSY